MNLAMSSATRILIGLVLTLSSLTHLANPYSFLESVFAYDLIPSRIATVIFAAVIPIVELILGVFLLFNRFRFECLFFSSIIFFVFLVAQAWMLTVGRKIPCGCFGYHEEPISAGSVSLTSAFFVIAIIGVFFTHRLGEPENETPSD